MCEQLIIRHCSPTLAGIKTANIFTYHYTDKEMLCREIRGLNGRLTAKGLCILPLRIDEKKAVVYVCRPHKLEQDLRDSIAIKLLEEYGYPSHSPFPCILKLADRLSRESDFPHEIGLFLGYPPEDVEGFIRHGAKDYKCVGAWKVYGDAEKAEKLFSRYKKCADVYGRLFEKGKSLEHLTVAH